MTTLDRYLVKKYLSTFGFVLLIFTLVSIAIDFSDKVQTFIEKPCTLKNIVVDYYAGWVIHMAGLILPTYTLISVTFFTSRMAFNSEILAILNAGVSFRRLLRPYLIAGSIVMVMHLVFNHFLIPKLNKSKLWFEHTFVWTDQERGRSSNVHFLLAPDVKVFVRGYNKSNKSISGLRLEKFDNNKIISILEANTANWKADPNVWTINDFSVRTFDGLRESYQKFATESRDTSINLTPQDFIFYQNQSQEMTTPELAEAIARDKSRGQSNSKNYEIEMHRRTADAFTNIILTIIGLSVAGRKVRGGMGLHLALGIGLGALYVLLSKFAVSFATSGSMSIGVGMWVPNMVFGLVALVLMLKAQK